MAKTSIVQRIKNWLTGGSKGSKSSGSKSTASSSQPKKKKKKSEEVVERQTERFNKRELLNNVRNVKEEPKQEEAKPDFTEKYKATKRTYKSMSGKDSGLADALNEKTDRLAKIRESNKQTSASSTNGSKKKPTADPKKKAAEESRARLQKRLDDLKTEREEFHKATNNKYNTKTGDEEHDRKAYALRVGGYGNASPEVQRHSVEYHPTITSAARGLASGGSFGATELAISGLSKRDKERAEAEKFYQENKDWKAEMAGEAIGALASFGSTAGATDRLGEMAIKKLAPNAAGKLAEKKFIQNAAKRSVNKAVKKGLIKESSEELIKQVGKDKAEKIVRAVGTDIVQNATTGLLYDFNKASAEHEIGSADWWKEMGKSAAFNAAITGGIAGGSALTGNKKLVRGAAETVANRARARQALGEMAERFRTSAGEAVAKNDGTEEAVRENLRRRLKERSVTAKGVPTRLGQNADEAVETIAKEATPETTIKQTANNAEQRIDRLEEAGELYRGDWEMNGNELSRDKYVANQQKLAEAYRAIGDEASAVSAEESIKRVDGNVKERVARQASDVAETTTKQADNAVEQTAKEAPRVRNEEMHDYLTSEIVPYRDKLNAFDERVKAIDAELEEAHRIAGDVNLDDVERQSAVRRYDELMEEARQLNEDIAIAREQAGETADSVEAAIRNDEMGEPTRTVNDEIRESLDPEERAEWTKAGDTERYTAEEAEEIKGQNWRTNDYHTKQGGTTVGVGMGDKKFRGAMEEAINNGDMTIEVYHDKENYEKGAQRILDYANGMGGESGKANLDSLAEKFERYAAGKEKINSKEARDMLYDILAAVDYANGMEDKALAERLFLSATKAGAELTSVSGLSLRQWHKIAMSSPEYRAKAVKQQIEFMFNQSRGFRKKFGKIKGTLKKAGETAGDNVDNFAQVGGGLDQFIKDNPDATKDLKEALDTLENAKSKEEVEAAASGVLLEARKVMPVTAFDQLTQWRYVAMLSSPTTHIKNIVGNIYSGTLGQMSGAISSGIENRLIRKGKVNADEYLKSSSGLSWSARNDAKVGVGEGIKLNNLKEQLENAKKQLAKADDKGLEAAQKKVADLEAKVAKAQQNFDNTSGKIKSVTGSKAQELFHSKSRDSLINDATKWEMQHGGVSGKALGKASEVLSMALETSDAVAVERIYRETADKVLRANNYEDWVKRAAESSGKEAKAAKAKVKQIEEYAAQHGAYKAALDTYRNYNAVASWMNKTIKNTLYNADAAWYKKAGGFALHAVMPFTKVPTNIVKRSLDYSPRGLLEGKKMLKKALDSGDYAEINKAVERMSEGLIGTGIAGLGLGMGMLDPDGMTITTRLDRDDPLDKAKKDRGYMDYSVKLGDRDYTLEWATPTASTFFVGVEIGRMLRNTYDKIADGQGFEFSPWAAIETSGEIMTRAIEPALQLTMFQGVNTVLEDSMESKYDEANINPIFKAMGNITSNYISSMQPSILNRLSRAFAPYDYYISGDTNAEYKKNLALSKIPIVSEKMFDAKTDAWGNPKNTADTAGEKALKAGVTLFSPMNVSKITWDDTDTKLYELYEETGDNAILPKVFYDSQNKGLQLGRNKDSAIDIDLSNNDAAQYNIARGKAGADAMSAALESVIFNRRTKDEKGISIPAEDAYTKEQKDALIKQFKGKGTKDVVKWVMQQPEYKNATDLEKKKIIKDVVGNGDTEASVGAKRASELAVAKRHNISEEEYDYRNEVTGKKQEELDEAIAAGVLTFKDAVDFNRGAAKVGYYTEEDSGGYTKSTYNRKNILEYLDSTDLSEDAKEALYNAYYTGKTPYGQEPRRGYYRRGYRRWHRWHRYGHGSKKKEKAYVAPKIKQSLYKASSSNGHYKSLASSLQTRSGSTALPTTTTKIQPPKVKFKKYEV